MRLKRKDQNQIQVATLRDLRAALLPDALGGRVNAPLPSHLHAPSSQEPPASAAPWQEQGTGQEHIPYLTASRLSPTCLPILADST